MILARGNGAAGGVALPADFIGNSQREFIMSTPVVANGKPRRQLSDQLDRLDEQLLQIDRVLDALSEGLNGAVVEATKEGTRIAVRDAVIALLTTRELRNALHQASMPETETKASFWTRAKAKARSVAVCVRTRMIRAASAVANRVRRARSMLGQLVHRARESTQVRTVVKVVVGISALVALARWIAVRGAGAVIASARTFVVEQVNFIRAWLHKSIGHLQAA